MPPASSPAEGSHAEEETLKLRCEHERMPAGGKVVGKAPQVGGSAGAKAPVQEQASRSRGKQCGPGLESRR